jgi:hypothetical protein
MSASMIENGFQFDFHLARQDNAESGIAQSAFQRTAALGLLPGGAV